VNADRRLLHGPLTLWWDRTPRQLRPQRLFRPRLIASWELVARRKKIYGRPAVRRLRAAPILQAVPAATKLANIHSQLRTGPVLNPAHWVIAHRFVPRFDGAMDPHFITILSGRNQPKFRQQRDPEPSIINEKTVADFTRVVEQTGILERQPRSPKEDA
jgi:hypothetical protein